MQLLEQRNKHGTSSAERADVKTEFHPRGPCTAKNWRRRSKEEVQKMTDATRTLFRPGTIGGGLRGSLYMNCATRGRTQVQ